jgi:hypothetical protein
MPRFQEMVNKWAEEHEEQIKKHEEWKEQRRSHFEQTVSQDTRLQNEEAGPPQEGWKFETYDMLCFNYSFYT